MKPTVSLIYGQLRLRNEKFLDLSWHCGEQHLEMPSEREKTSKDENRDALLSHRDSISLMDDLRFHKKFYQTVFPIWAWN